MSLSSDGTRLAIGAPNGVTNGNTSGLVRVFELSEDNWTQLGQTLVGDAATDGFGFAVSLSADGNRVAVGAPREGDGLDRGQVNVFELNADGWSLVGDTILGDAAGDLSGFAVSLSAGGDRVAIGSPSNDDGGIDSGKVRVFDFNGGEWTQVGEDIVGEEAESESGYAVSLSANGVRVAIGAPLSGQLIPFQGHVGVFELIGDNWERLAEAIVGNGGSASGSAVSMSADGKRVAIGAPVNNGLAGQVRVFEFRNDAWEQLGSNIDGETSLDESGRSISLSADGSRIAIGAPQPRTIGTSGYVRVFELSGHSWNQMGQDLDGQIPGDENGRAVSLTADGNRVATGAPRNDDNGEDSGEVRVFEFRPAGHWFFQGENSLADRSGNFPDLTLFGTSRVLNGLLMVKGNGDTPTGYARSVGTYQGREIGEKTLVACVALYGLDDVANAGSVLTLASQDGSLFDGMVFSELEANRWMAGSNNYRRTENFNPGFEETTTGEFVQLAISYQNINDEVLVVGYRGETEIGRYLTSNPSRFANGDAEVNFGLRHRREGNPVGALQGAIVEASVYDFVLGEKSIAKLASRCAAPPSLLFEDGFETKIAQ